MYRIAQNPSFEGGKLSWKVPRNSIAEFHAFHTELTLASRQSSFANAPHAGSNSPEIIPIQPRNMEKAMNITNSVVAIYDTHEQAEKAIKELQEAGVDMKSLSIAAKDTHTDEHVVGYYNAGDRMKHWGKLGAFWGGFWGLLFGSGIVPHTRTRADSCSRTIGGVDYRWP